MGLVLHVLLHGRQARDSRPVGSGQDRGRITISIDVGSRTYLLVNCAENSQGFSSDSDGTADLTIAGVAPDALRVRASGDAGQHPRSQGRHGDDRPGR